MATTRQLLKRTYDILKERGLAKQTHRGRDGSVCVFGALEIARNELGMAHDEACIAGQRLYDANGGNNPASLNDAVDTNLGMMLNLVAAAF